MGSSWVWGCSGLWQLNPKHIKNIQKRRDLIDMRTHELKTPLSTLKFALASQKMA